MLAPPPKPVGPSEWALPDPGAHDEDLVGFGADLAPETLIDAYRRGIFPWPHEGAALPWFSPDPRALLRADTVHVSSTLRSRLRRCGWETTVDAAFDEVMAESAAARADAEGTWITDEMQAAYSRLHRLGWAHSVEVWDGAELVGGIYGVAVGGCFTGESMFHRVVDGSKAALVDLCARWWEAGGAFVDAQLPTGHLERMGAVTIARAEFLSMLGEVRDRPARLTTDRLPVSRLVSAEAP